MVYAGFWRRLAALLLDAVFVLIPAALLNLIIPYVGALVAHFLYVPFFLSSEIKATPGMVIMDLQLVDTEGRRVDFLRVLARWCLTALSALLLFFGYFMNLFTPKRQTLHDMITDTVVVRVAHEGEVDWFGAWKREFMRVFNMSEAPIAAAPADFGGATVMTEAPSEPSRAAETLETLHRLHQQGVLTDAEYAAKKEQILKRI